MDLLASMATGGVCIHNFCHGGCLLAALEHAQILAMRHRWHLGAAFMMDFAFIVLGLGIYVVM